MRPYSNSVGDHVPSGSIGRTNSGVPGRCSSLALEGTPAAPLFRPAAVQSARSWNQIEVEPAAEGVRDGMAAVAVPAGGPEAVAASTQDDAA
jgi:hypothetical protein